MEVQSRQKKSASKILRWLGFGAGAAILLSGVAIAVLLSIDLGRFKATILDVASDAVGRDIRIEGELSIRLGRDITIDVAGISIAGVAPRDPPIIEVAHASVRVDTRSLIRGVPHFDAVSVTGLEARLDVYESGSSNWDLGSETNLDETGIDESAGFRIEIDSLDVNRAGVSIRSPALQSPLVIELESLSHRIAEDRQLHTSLDGRVNGRELVLTSNVSNAEDIRAGRPVNIVVDGHLDAIELTAIVDLDNLFAPARPAVDFSLVGPDVGYLFDILNLPHLTSGPLDARLSIANRDDRIDISARGDVGEFRLDGSGWVGSLRQPDRFEFRLDTSGPDLSHVGRLGGVDLLPAVPFALQASVARDDEIVQLESVELSIGGTTLSINGKLDSLAPLSVDSLAATMRADNVWELLPWSERPADLPGEFALDARLLEPANGLARVSMVGALADVSGEAVLAIPSLDGLKGLIADFDVRTDTLELPAALLGLPALSGMPFSASGQAEIQDDVVRLQNLSASLGDASIVADGQLETAYPGNRSMLELSFEVPGLARTLAPFGIPGVPGFGAAGQVSARLDGEWLRIPALDVDVGGAHIDGSAAVNLGSPGSAFDLNLSAATDDAATMLAEFFDWPIPGQAGRAEINLSMRDERLTLRRVTADLGEMQLAASGIVDRPPNLDATALDIEFRVPSMAQLDIRESPTLPDEPFALIGHFTGTADAILGDGVSVTLGSESAALDFRYEPGDTPFVAVGASSPRLDLRPLIPEPGQQESRPKTEKKDRLIPDIKIPVDSLKAMNLDLRLRVARLVTWRRGYSDVRLDVTLDDGSLQVSDLHFKGRHGEVTSMLDYRPRDDRYDLRFSVRGDDLRLAPLNEREDQVAARPAVHVEADLTSTGTTMRDLAAMLNGTVLLQAGKGMIPESSNFITRFFLGDLVYEILGTINPLTRKDETVVLECGIATLDILNGTISGNPALVARLPAVTVITRGSVNLQTEALDADFNVLQRRGVGISVNDIVNPYTKVAGTLAKPTISLDQKGALLEGGAAFATGGLTVLAKGLKNRFLSDADPCGSALTAYRERHAEAQR